ncbi:hypothetical protein [Peribacillus glennii]|uniref:Uncharacterized protein n=1 Tax=Peribacillus glennii TaxID=2303991 RepID=A0A372LH48_9BACI|nr:hypothetical protein [Peribacillus glennii]RFU65611.1 hypothetical protein D0466_06965 [Peribacillus glennii]
MQERQGNVSGGNPGSHKNDLFNREELNNVHVKRERSTDRTGEDMIDGDNLLAKTYGDRLR